jgi:Uma2 family endonuclease
MPTIDVHEKIELPPPPVVEHPPRIRPTPPPVQIPRFDLPDNDEVPMETPWHRSAMTLLIESVQWHLRDRTDFFVGGNMFIYYGARQARTWEYRGPDFLFVDRVDGTRPRRYWMVFEEDGRYPNVIIELLSPSTATEDRTTKKVIYEQTFRTPEYFLYEPAEGRLEGWRHDGQSYQPVQPDARGWLWSEQLGLWLGTWQGTYHRIEATWPRFYDRDDRLVPIQAEEEHRRAEEEHRRAEEEHRRAEEAEQRAEQERQRAEALAADLARLQALLKEKGLEPPGS